MSLQGDKEIARMLREGAAARLADDNRRRARRVGPKRPLSPEAKRAKKRGVTFTKHRPVNAVAIAELHDWREGTVLESELWDGKRRILKRSADALELEPGGRQTLLPRDVHEVPG